MSQFKKLKFGNTRSLVRHTGKGASEQVLPNRHALNTLTAGAPGSRSISDYAKATPGADMPSPSILDYGANSDY